MPTRAEQSRKGKTAAFCESAGRRTGHPGRSQSLCHHYVSVLLFELVGAASLLVWIYLLIGRGGFWRVSLSPIPKLGAPAKSVVAVIPARNEEPVVGRAVSSLLNQDYSGSLRIVLVNDHSTDRTIAAAGTHERMSIVEADLARRLDG